jgi:hypothetical protein
VWWARGRCRGSGHEAPVRSDQLPAPHWLDQSTSAGPAGQREGDSGLPRPREQCSAGCSRDSCFSVSRGKLPCSIPSRSNSDARRNLACGFPGHALRLNRVWARWLALSLFGPRPRGRSEAHQSMSHSIPFIVHSTVLHDHFHVFLFISIYISISIYIKNRRNYKIHVT